MAEPPMATFGSARAPRIGVGGMIEAHPRARSRRCNVILGKALAGLRGRADIPNRTVEDEVTKPQNNRSNGQLSTSPVRVNRGEPAAREADGDFPRPRSCQV